MKTQILTIVFAILAPVIFGAANIKAAPGDLDTTFGNGGVVTTNIVNYPYGEGAGAMLVQPDGKIVVCGWIDDSDSSSDVAYFIARYNLNGTLDDSFGTNGKIINEIGESGALAGFAIALQSDGKIITAGGTTAGLGGYGVHRHHANGTLDAFFGTGGVVIVTPFLFPNSAAVQADGKIVIAGSSYLGTESHFTVIRLNPDGSLDTSFNGTGMVITPFVGDSEAAKVVLQPDGKIVAVGKVEITETYYAGAIARYNSNGTLDSDFGSGGKVVFTLGNSYTLNDAVLQPNGKIAALGYYWTVSGTSGTAVVRFNSNGSVDDPDGIFTTEENFLAGRGIALQSDGKLVAFGRQGLAFSDGFAVLRLNPDLKTDEGFGNNGRVITPNTHDAVDGAVQPDGKILAFGKGNFDIALVRYLGDSTVPQRTKFDFDGDGRSDISVFRPSDRIWYLNQSTNGFSATQFGLSTDKLTPADFDGDGKTDIAVFREGIWYWLNSSNQSVEIIQFGLPDDIPVPADYTGDGRAELAVYRNGTWWLLNLVNDQVSTIQFGLASDKPVFGDYDGDGRTDQAVYRGSGEWHINGSTQGYTVINWGLPTDKPVPADYDGDGRADQAVYRDGTWYLLQSSNGFRSFQWGISTDIPAPADYDGDGKIDPAVYRNGTWWIWQSTDGVAIQQFGLTDDKPIPSAYLQ